MGPRLAAGSLTIGHRGPHPPAEMPSSVLARWALAVLVGSLAVSFAVAVLQSFGANIVALVVAALVGVTVGVAAVVRFETFVLMLIAARSALDAFGQGGLDGGAVDPAAAVGAVFVTTSGLWLLMRYAVGDWVKPSPPTKALLALGAASVASAAFSPMRVAAAEGASRVLSGVLMFAVVEQLLARSKDPYRFIGALFAAAVIPMAVGYGQLITGTGASLRTEAGRVYGTFAHPNVFASFLVTVMLLALALALGDRGRFRRLAVLVLLCAGPLLLFTYTRAAWLALVAGALYLGFRLDRRVLWALALVVATVVAVAPSIVERVTDVTTTEEVHHDAPTNSLEWRMQYWGEVLPLAADAPLTGVGVDVTHRLTATELPPHNTFVQAYVETGIFGAAALVAVVVTFAAHLRRRLRQATTDLELLAAVAAISVAIAALMAAPSQNLLSRTSGYWYLAVAMLHGFALAHGDGRRSTVTANPVARSRDGR